MTAQNNTCYECPYFLRYTSYCAYLRQSVKNPLIPPCRFYKEKAPPSSTNRKSLSTNKVEAPYKQRRSPISTGIILLLIILLIFSNLAWYLGYSQLNAQHNSLLSQYQSLRFSYDYVLSMYGELENNYSALKNNYYTISQRYQVLENNYSELAKNYKDLQLSYINLLENYVSLNKSASQLMRELKLLAYVPDSFSRVLNWSAVEAIGKYVIEAGVSSTDFWGSLQAIFRYIRTKVRYTWDVEIPIVWDYDWILSPDGRILMSTLHYFYYRNYVQTPEFTIKYGQGDCDDQAVLAYAMIKYYMLKVYGKEYELYVAYIEFDKDAHLAVFLPVSGGQLTIIDPAGSYISTDSTGRIHSWFAKQELQMYYDWWSSAGYHIQRIVLYSVDVKSGSYKQVVAGNLEQVSDFLSKT